MTKIIKYTDDDCLKTLCLCVKAFTINEGILLNMAKLDFYK